MSSCELKPVYDSRKSFYGKAYVNTQEDKEQLFSYNTLVCELRTKGQDDIDVTIFNVQDSYGTSLTFSPTTLRHIKEFLRQNDIKAIDAQQIRNDYTVKPAGNVDRLN